MALVLRHVTYSVWAKDDIHIQRLRFQVNMALVLPAWVTVHVYASCALTGPFCMLALFWVAQCLQSQTLSCTIVSKEAKSQKTQDEMDGCPAEYHTIYGQIETTTNYNQRLFAGIQGFNAMATTSLCSGSICLLIHCTSFHSLTLLLTT